MVKCFTESKADQKLCFSLLCFLCSWLSNCFRFTISRNSCRIVDEVHNSSIAVVSSRPVTHNYLMSIVVEENSTGRRIAPCQFTAT